MTQAFLTTDELNKQSAGTNNSMNGAQSVTEKIAYVKGKGNISKEEQDARAKLRLEFREQYRTGITNGASGSSAYDKTIADQLKESQDTVVGVSAEKRITWLATSATALHYREQVDLIKQKALQEMLSREGGERSNYSTVLQVAYRDKKSEVDQILEQQEEIRSLILKGGSDWVANYEKAHNMTAIISEKLSKDPALKEALAAAQLMKELGIPEDGTVSIADDSIRTVQQKTDADIAKVRAWVGADDKSAFASKGFKIENYSIPMGGYIGYRLMAALADIQPEEGKPGGTGEGNSDGGQGGKQNNSSLVIPADLSILVGKNAKRFYEATILGGESSDNRGIGAEVEWQPISTSKAKPKTGDDGTAVLINTPSDLMLSMVSLDADGKPVPFKTPRGWNYCSIYLFGNVRTSNFVNGSQLDKAKLAEAMKKELEAFMADPDREYLPVYIVQNTKWLRGLDPHMGYLTKDAVRSALGKE